MPDRAEQSFVRGLRVASECPDTLDIGIRAILGSVWCWLFGARLSSVAKVYHDLLLDHLPPWGRPPRQLQQDRSSNGFTTDGPTGFHTHIRGMWGLIVDVVQGVLTSDRTPVG